MTVFLGLEDNLSRRLFERMKLTLTVVDTSLGGGDLRT